MGTTNITFFKRGIDIKTLWRLNEIIRVKMFSYPSRRQNKNGNEQKQQNTAKGRKWNSESGSQDLKLQSKNRNSHLRSERLHPERDRLVPERT